MPISSQTFAIGDAECGFVLQTHLLGESIRCCLGVVAEVPSSTRSRVILKRSAETEPLNPDDRRRCR